MGLTHKTGTQEGPQNVIQCVDGVDGLDMDAGTVGQTEQMKVTRVEPVEKEVEVAAEGHEVDVVDPPYMRKTILEEGEELSQEPGSAEPGSSSYWTHSLVYMILMLGS